MSDKTGTKLTRKDFASDQEVRWCPGCGDYSILAQMQRALPDVGIPRERIVFISGIGCSSRFPYYMDTYGFHGIHGRAPAIASGLKMVQPELCVFVITGDGDGLSMGTSHLLHAIRRNIDINIILFNNQIYGLTKGQYSPTSLMGQRTKSTPMGSIDRPVHPLTFALAADATFVARSFDRDPKHLQMVLRRAVEHKGTSFVEVFQNCNIFNDKAFEHFTEKDVRAERTVYLEHGKPLTFGKKENPRGLRLDQLDIVDVPLSQSDEASLLHHDEKRDSSLLAELLSKMTPPELPMALGVFRAIERPSYEALMQQQLDDAKERSRSDLQQVLAGPSSWTVD
jgi:2-oxoglutarate ferredoxin oxidoreductase subunit beta